MLESHVFTPFILVRKLRGTQLFQSSNHLGGVFIVPEDMGSRHEKIGTGRNDFRGCGLIDPPVDTNPAV